MSEGTTRSRVRGASGLLGLGLVVALALAVAEEREPHPPIDFGEHVGPILQKRCGSCHTGEKERGGLSMESRERLLEGGDSGPVLVPGSSEGSRLIAVVSGKDPDLAMPPKGERLTDAEVAVLSLWIDQGARWAEGIALGPEARLGERPKTSRPVAPRRPELPPSPSGTTHPVDRIVEAYWSARGIDPGPPIDDRTFLRRVTLDLVGLLPSPPELEEFLRDEHPDKRAHQVSRLLDDRKAYAEHWLSFFNDLLRNDYEGPGYIDGGRKPITDWLYEALYHNKPYDRIVSELVSPTARSEGFSYGIKWRGRVNASQVRELQFSQNVSQAFLGINMKCASCHDSFINDWKLDDAYGLAAIYAEGPIEIHRCDIPTGRTAEPGFLFPELGRVDPAAPREERLAQLATLLVSPENGRLSRTIVNRLWARLLGRGLVEPLDVLDNDPWSLDLLDYLGSRLVEDGHDLKKMPELIVTSRAYQSRCAAERSEDERGFVFRGPQLKRMTAEQLLDAVWAVTSTAPASPDVKIPIEPEGPTRATFVRASLKKADPLQSALGRPNREQIVSSRPPVMTTLMALDLTNGEELAGLLERGSRNLLEELSDRSTPEVIRDVYVRALGRPPSEEERLLAEEIVGSPPDAKGLEDFLWALFMLPEFQLIH